MAPLYRIASVVVCLVCVAQSASAQFDNQWVRFAQDTTRIEDSNGAAATYITGDVQEKDMATGDLDKDGWTDLIIVRKQPFTTTGAFANYLLMNESGVLVDRTAQYASDTDVPGDSGFLTPTNDRDVVVVDVDLDGWLDVVTATTMADAQPKHISHPRVYMNKGNDVNGHWLGLRFENNRIPTMSPAPHFCAVAAGDVTGDGYPDLYFVDYGALADKLLINDGAGNFSDSGTTRMTMAMLDVRFGTAACIVDMNGDGFKDIVRASGSTGTTGTGPLTSVSYNNPANPGFFSSGMYQSPVGSAAPYHVDVGDLNNDNKPDFIVSDDGSDSYSYNTGNDGLGRVAWSPVKTYSSPSGSPDDGFAGTNLIVDLNNDGWKDTIHCDVDVDAPGYSRHCHIYHNPGGTPGSQITLKYELGQATGAWKGAVGLFDPDLICTFDVAAFDIDNDGDTDIVFGRCSGTYVWMNQLVQPPIFTSYCSGDGTGTACPCSAGSAGRGCPSASFASGGRIAATGLARIASDSLVLTSTTVPPFGPGLFFQGTSAIASGAAFGNGLLCASGATTRLEIKFADAAGTSASTVAIHTLGGAASGDLRYYQMWYRDDPSFCTAAGFNLTNALSLTWAP